MRAQAAPPGASPPSAKHPETKARRGTAVIEFAAGSELLLAVFAGSFEFGYTLLVYNKLQNAVVLGAWYASPQPYDSATTSPSPAYLAAVQNMVLYGSPTAGATTVLSGLETANVNLSVRFTNGAPSATSVSISGYAIHSVFGVTTLTNKPQVTFSYRGIWTPI
jgi:Flp pilus assembly protein TadG